MDDTDRPAWEHIADTLRRRIADGTYPVGRAIPSYTELRAEFDVSVTPVRQAVAALRNEGLLRGRQGAGVYVTQTPQTSPSDLDRFSELEARIADLQTQLDSQGSAQGRIEARLIELYARLGQPYPGPDERPRKRATGA